jgi:hypothetical protein
MIGSRLSDDRASRGRGYGAARNRGRYSGHKRGGGARPQSTVQTSTRSSAPPLTAITSGMRQGEKSAALLSVSEMVTREQ